jgi:methionyl-tRNA formyltransferase
MTFYIKNMTTINVIFFGSTSDSVLVIDKLFNFSLQPSAFSLQLKAVITQPPKPIGRKQIITPTPVAVWAKQNNIPSLTFTNDPIKSWQYQDESQVIAELTNLKPDLLISASYGQMIPSEIIKYCRFGGINIHPSLLPRWRGADPLPWTILAGDTQTGVTLITLSDKFDQGKIIASKQIKLTGLELPDSLRTQLFDLGSDLLVKILPDYVTGKIEIKPQNSSEVKYARKLTRQDGFIPWKIIKLAIDNPSQIKSLPIMENLNISGVNLANMIERIHRAFSPWPGIWSEVQIRTRKMNEIAEKTDNRENKIFETKRLKILSISLSQPTTPYKHPLTHQSSLSSQLSFQIGEVQLDGKKPVSYNLFLRDHELLDN